MFRPASLQGSDSFLDRCIDKNIEDVASALKEALSAASDDYTLSRIRRCLDQLRGESVGRVLVNRVQPARGYVGATVC